LLLLMCSSSQRVELSSIKSRCSIVELSRENRAFTQINDGDCEQKKGKKLHRRGDDLAQESREMLAEAYEVQYILQSY
jgi:hypothetical protein